MLKGDIRKEIPITSFTKKAKFYPYIVFDNKQQKTVGNVFLTEDQANELNRIMKIDGANKQRYAFLIGWE